MYLLQKIKRETFVQAHTDRGRLQTKKVKRLILFKTVKKMKTSSFNYSASVMYCLSKVQD